MSFTPFTFHPLIAANIQSCGYTQPTPIQKQAITPALAGRDVLGLAQTGTGKTAAFVLPIVQKLLTNKKQSQALILAPTRELAEQIHGVVLQMAKGTGIRSVAIYGGVGKQPQLKAMRQGTEVIVACPGRLLDNLNEKDLNLNRVTTFVLDEADHMFDKGFLPDIRKIVNLLPAKRQALVFSATMPQEIRHLVDNLLHRPEVIQIDHTLPAATISHAMVAVTKQEKTAQLKELLADKDLHSAVVFTRTKHKAKSLAQQLEKKGFNIAAIQGNMSQQKRKQVMDRFRQGNLKILVATDIAARGIDVSGVSHVINYDIPDTLENYTHRTGRTGRAENQGIAITFAEPGDLALIRRIENKLGKKMIDKTELRSVQLSQDSTQQRPAPRPKNSAPAGQRSKGRKFGSRYNPRPGRAATK